MSTMTWGSVRTIGRNGPDPKRVIAIAAVVSLHLLVIGQLLLPQQPLLLSRVVPLETPLPIDRVPLPPAPKKLVPIVQQKPLPIRRIEPRKPIEVPPPPLTQSQVFVPDRSDSDELASNLPVAPPTRDQGAPTKPARAGLNTTSAPAPVYPPRALRKRLEGDARLRILVGANGRALEVQVLASTGSDEFGRFAKKAVLQRWRFKPAEVGGVATEAWGEVTIRFRLND